MTNPTDLQRFMAELMGWTDIHEWADDIWGTPPGCTKEEEQILPNWPGDRDASYRDLIHGTSLLKDPN